MTIELQQISPWFQTTFGVRMRPEMGRSAEGTVNRSMSRNRDNTPERKERKRGQLITHLKRLKWLWTWPPGGTNSMESREEMIDGENNVISGQPLSFRWLRHFLWKVSNQQSRLPKQTRKKKLDLQIYLHSSSWRWSGGMRWPNKPVG